MRSRPLILGLMIVLTLTITVSVLAKSPQTPTAICTWNGSSGNWSDTTKWTGCNGAAPSTNDTAVIGSGTVTVDQDVTVQGLTLSGGTLQGSNTLTATQTMTWSGCAVLAGTGATTVGSSAMLTVTWGGGAWACPSMNGRTLNLLGNAVVTASDGHYLNIQGGSIINNSGTLDLQDSVTLSGNGSGNVVNNMGLLRKVGGAGSSALSAMSLTNTGTLEVVTGTLNLNGGGNSGGAFNVSTGAALQFNSDFTLDPGATLVGTGPYRLLNGTLTVSGSLTVPNFEQTGGTLSGGGILTVTQAMAWSNCAALNGSGATTIGNSATLTVTWGGGAWACPSMNGRTLNLLGNAVFAPSDGHYVSMANGSIINNAGTLDLQDNVTLSGNGNSTVVNNTGLVRKVGGTGTSTLNGVALNNIGTVQALTGTLNLNGGGTSSGNFNAATGATLNFGGGTHVITQTSSLTGAGTLGVSGGSLTIGGNGTYTMGSTTVSGGTLTMDRDGTTSNLALISAAYSNGTLNGSGFLTVTQAMVWSGCGALNGSGTTTLGSSGTLTVTWGGGAWACPSMDGRTLNLLGNAVVTASDGHYLNIQGGSMINNSGTLDLQDSVILLGSGSGNVVNNTGLLRKVGGTGTSSVSGMLVNNTGMVQVLTGTLSFGNFAQYGGSTALNGGILASSGNPLNFYGGMLQGSGAVNGNVVNLGGTVSPGMSPGVLHIAGNYTQGPTGALGIELGGAISGTQYDLLDVTGAASLSGTLNVSLINSFTPISGTVFRIVNFNTRSGDFITETGTNLGWLTLLPYYSSDHLSLIAGTTVADLGINVTDSKSYAIAGDPVTYTVVVTNAGPDAATGTIVTDTLPGTISNVTWTCVATNGNCVTLSGSGNLSTTVNLNAGGVSTFTIGGRLSPAALGTLVNTAYVSHPTDPDQNNNSATDSDSVLYLKLYLPLIIN